MRGSGAFAVLAAAAMIGIGSAFGSEPGPGRVVVTRRKLDDERNLRSLLVPPSTETRQQRRARERAGR